jgi:hypothetical protein
MQQEMGDTVAHLLEPDWCMARRLAKSHATEAKANHSSNLSTFLLQTMPNLVDKRIIEGWAEGGFSISIATCYRTGRSTDNTLHNVVTRTESDFDARKQP